MPLRTFLVENRSHFQARLCPQRKLKATVPADTTLVAHEAVQIVKVNIWGDITTNNGKSWVNDVEGRKNQASTTPSHRQHERKKKPNSGNSCTDKHSPRMGSCHEGQQQVDYTEGNSSALAQAVRHQKNSKVPVTHTHTLTHTHARTHACTQVGKAHTHTHMQNILEPFFQQRIQISTFQNTTQKKPQTTSREDI